MVCMKRFPGWICAAGLAGCNMLVPGNLPRPADLEAAGVRLGEAVLQKSVWLDAPDLGEITSITDAGTRGVLVAGTSGAGYAKDGVLGDRVAWKERLAHVEPVDVEGDGQWEYLDRGGHGWQGAALVDGGGGLRFRPATGQGVDDMAAGALDGDGRLDFVVGYNGGSGVARYDAGGHELWRQDDSNVWHVEIVDTDADGVAEIVHSNAAGKLTIRDASGRVVRRLDPPGPYFSEFSLVRWPRSAQPRPLHAGDGFLWITDYSGAVAARLDAPGVASLGDAHATPVRFGNEDWLAAVVEFSHWDRSVVYVFAAAGKLAYHEVAMGACRPLVPAPTGNGDDLLLGCGTRIWRYRVATRPPPPR